MEQFYKLLKEYNTKFVSETTNLPEWFFQYTAEEPPLYWKTVFEILKNEDKGQSIIEIGAGYGDITALLYFMGFNNIISFELDSQLIKHIDDKIRILFNTKANTINERYPFKLDISPDILIQVNCIYSDNAINKYEYLKQIRSIYQINGIPNTFIFESIDDSYREQNVSFPEHIRLNKNDLMEAFQPCQIKSFNTYTYPQNKVTKILYSICK